MLYTCNDKIILAYWTPVVLMPDIYDFFENELDIRIYTFSESEYSKEGDTYEIQYQGYIEYQEDY